MDSMKKSINLNTRKVRMKNSQIKQITPELMSLLRSDGYNDVTIRSYWQHFQRFINYYNQKEAENISFIEIREYLIYLVEVKKYSVSSQNNAINAIKCYYKEVLNIEIDDYYVPRPRNPKINPTILNEKEVSAILKSIRNLRDKCMIYLIYSAGLTPSEILFLKPNQIDSKKMKIFITSPKGDNDRFVILSVKVLGLLREYFIKYKPDIWLFESKPGKQYTKRTLQKSFKKAVERSGIHKPATLTILKNSFIVHLLDKGVDIRYIQQILGHKNSRSTMRYLRICKRDFRDIQSPLDNLEV